MIRFKVLEGFRKVHLSTCIVVMFIAGLFLMLNLTWSLDMSINMNRPVYLRSAVYYVRGWPFTMQRVFRYNSEPIDLSDPEDLRNFILHPDKYPRFSDVPNDLHKRPSIFEREWSVGMLVLNTVFLLFVTGSVFALLEFKAQRERVSRA